MPTLDDSEQAFEAKFAHDEELKFKVLARRDKLVGLWAAAKLGKAGADAEDYARLVILSDLEEAGDDDIVRKLVADLAGTGTGEAEIRAALAEQTRVAHAQVMGAD